MTRAELVKELDYVYAPNTIYRNINTLLESNEIIQLKNKRLIIQDGQYHPKHNHDAPADFQLPQALAKYIHDDKALPCINVMQHKHKELKTLLEEQIIPNHGQELALRLIVLLLLLQISNDNSEVFYNYPELKYTPEIHEEGMKQINAALYNLI